MLRVSFYDSNEDQCISLHHCHVSDEDLCGRGIWWFICLVTGTLAERVVIVMWPIRHKERVARKMWWSSCWRRWLSVYQMQCTHWAPIDLQTPWLDVFLTLKGNQRVGCVTMMLMTASLLFLITVSPHEIRNALTNQLLQGWREDEVIYAKYYAATSCTYILAFTNHTLNFSIYLSHQWLQISWSSQGTLLVPELGGFYLCWKVHTIQELHL